MKANPKRTQAMLRYYMRGHSLRETGQRFGCTYQRVHQVVRKHARQKMRGPYFHDSRERA